MDYIELHTHSNFSLLDGASFPEALVAQAAALGMPALALTDHDAVYGAVGFVRAAKAAGIKPVLGAELTLVGDHHLTLLVETAAGWENLCSLISLARANAPKGQAALPPEALEGHTAGLIALSGCRHGEIASALLRRDRSLGLNAARRYQELFGQDNFWIELQHHRLGDDEELIEELAGLALKIRAGIVATNNVHYATRDAHQLQQILVCIRHNTALDASEQLRRPNSEYYLKSSKQMMPLFAAYPEALANTARIAERCDFSLAYGLQDLPPFATPGGQSTEAYLRDLCLAAAARKYPDNPSNVTARLHYELEVIQRSGLSNYFLVIWDIVCFSRANSIRCQGRGSAANSLVAHLLNISPIDPLAHDLVFERFLSDERKLAPDVDIDFDAARREEVIQYIYEKFGHDHAAMACNYSTFRARSALRDVGKALGLSPALIDLSAKQLDTRDAAKIGEALEVQGSEPWEQLLELCAQIDGFPRHLGIHNGGMIIIASPLASRLPTEPATMPDRVVVQWDKDGLEEIGLVKIDILGLRMLSALDDAVAIIEEQTGKRPDLDALTFDDPAVYEMISQADTVGVFQTESRAQAQMLPRMRPRTFNDIIIAISLIRPGPIIGDMVHPYLRRRSGEEEVSYPHPKLKPALEETLGVILFQEQVLKVARDLAGFTPGQGEILRRALGSKHASKLLEGLHEAFIQGAEAQGVEVEVAEDVFKRLRGFGSYSFPKAHAASFAVVVYQSAWLKRYYPAAFLTAILRNQPMGFWQPAEILDQAKREGIHILPVDVNCSKEQCSVEDGAIRIGLDYVKGLGEASIARVEGERVKRSFADLADLCKRTRLPRRLVENLILAGAMSGWKVDQRELLWQLTRLRYEVEELDLLLPDSDFKPQPMSVPESMGYEREVTGLNVAEHPMALYREWLSANGVLDSVALAECPSGQKVIVAGMKIMHQSPPTAKGMHFITLTDEHNMINLVIRPNVYASYKQVLRRSPLIVAEGEVQRKNEVINILVERASQLSPSG
jgi:error-prone DNA polymerase